MSSPEFESRPSPPVDNPFVRFWVDVWRCIRRVVTSNFQTTRVTDREAGKLAFSGTPISEPVGQSYAAWRRSALWIAAIALFIHVIILFSTFQTTETAFREAARKSAEKALDQEKELARKHPEIAARRAMMPSDRKRIKKAEDEFIDKVGTNNCETIDGVILTGHALVLVSSIFVLFSAIFWSNLKVSRLIALIGWCVMFAGPVLLAFVPISSLLDLSDAPKETRKYLVTGIGAIFAVRVFLFEGSKVLAIFPGIIRSSMGLKTLLPESATPGWIVALIAPIYALFMLLLAVTLNQMQGSVFLIIAAFCLMLAPLIYLFFGKAIVRPHNANEIGSIVIPVRLGVTALNIGGVIFLSIFAVDSELIDVGNVFKFIFGLVANVLLLTVVVTDVVIQNLRRGYIQSRGFQESRLREKLDRRFAALAEIGRRRSKGEAAPPPVREAAAETPFDSSGRKVDDSLVIDSSQPKGDDSLVIDNE